MVDKVNSKSEFETENQINSKKIAAAIADQGGKASLRDIMDGTEFGPSYTKWLCLDMIAAGYFKGIDSDAGTSYELTGKGWALVNSQRDLEQVKQSRLAALARLSHRELRSLMQADFS